MATGVAATGLGVAVLPRAVNTNSLGSIAGAAGAGAASAVGA